jgi:hypothetical protein
MNNDSKFRAPFMPCKDCNENANVQVCCRKDCIPPDPHNRSYAYYSIPDWCCGSKGSLQSRPPCVGCAPATCTAMKEPLLPFPSYLCDVGMPVVTSEMLTVKK